MVVGGWVVGGWVLDFTRLMLISTQVEVVVGVELGNNVLERAKSCLNQRLNTDVNIISNH